MAEDLPPPPRRFQVPEGAKYFCAEHLIFFAERIQIVDHLRRHHARKDKRLLCDDCVTGFSGRYAWKEHRNLLGAGHHFPLARSVWYNAADAGEGVEVIHEPGVGPNVLPIKDVEFLKTGEVEGNRVN